MGCIVADASVAKYYDGWPCAEACGYLGGRASSFQAEMCIRDSFLARYLYGEGCPCPGGLYLRISQESSKAG